MLACCAARLVLDIQFGQTRSPGDGDIDYIPKMWLVVAWSSLKWPL